MGENRYQKLKAIATVVTILIVVSALVLIAFHTNQPIGTPPLYPIVDASFTVNAGTYKAYNFTTPTDISSCQVTGDFSISPTNSSGFRVFLWDNASFTNWQSGHSSQLGSGTISFYDSDHLTNGTISASPYPGGTYFLIFLNNKTAPVNVTSKAFFWYIRK